MTVQAILVFFLLDCGFRLLGFSRVFSFIDRWCRRSVGPRSLGTQRATVRKAQAAVRIAARYYCRWRLDCLPRAMTLYVLLRRRGIPATLSIGVKRFPFAAHAWVECLGEVLDDSRDDWQHEPYVPILSARGSAQLESGDGSTSSKSIAFRSSQE